MYRFPVINSIDDVGPALEGHEEFFIAQREFGFVANYMVSMPTSFVPTDESVQAHEYAMIRRECRGLCFGPDGKVIARRFHKFFNVGEKPETFIPSINYNFHPYYLMDKLDGSMITPIPMPDGSIRWGTKMGLTDVAKPVEDFVSIYEAYIDVAMYCRANKLTPIFEWTSRKQRIVLDYPEDQLTLLALRDNITGEYENMDSLARFASKFGVPMVQTKPLKFRNAEDFAVWQASLDDVSGIEGYVWRYDNGHMMKIKTPWYCKIHAAKEDLVHEKNVVEMIVRETVDDLKEHLMEEDRQRLESFETEFWKGFLFQHNCIGLALHTIRERYPTKKDFALSDEAPWIRSIVFKMWDRPHEELMPHLKQIILNNVSSQSKVDSIRWMWNGARWEYGALPPRSTEKTNNEG